MVREDRINDFFNGRTFLIIVAVLFVAMSYIASIGGRFAVIDDGNGIFFHISDDLLNNKTESFILNIVCVLGCAVMIVMLNSIFNFIRAFTFIHASMFLLLQLALPFTSTYFYVGTALGVVFLGATFLLFSTYQQKQTSQRRIFIAFLVVAVCCMFHYAFLGFIPVLLIGFMQMRAMNFKGFLAMLIGIVTPFWIVIGLGIVQPDSFNVPNISAVWKTLHLWQAGLVITIVASAAVLSIVLSVINMFSTFNYRLELRVFNAFLIVINVLSIISMCVDYNHLLFYMPILNLCLAVQIAHTYTISNSSHRYIFIILLIVCSFAVYASQILA